MTEHSVKAAQPDVRKISWILVILVAAPWPIRAQVQPRADWLDGTSCPNFRDSIIG
jgi:hypothetical protein